MIFNCYINFAHTHTHRNPYYTSKILQSSRAGAAAESHVTSGCQDWTQVIAPTGRFASARELGQGNGRWFTRGGDGDRWIHEIL